MEELRSNFLFSVIRQMEHYKSLGEKAMEQLEDHQLNVQLDDESNSIGTIVKHLWGNMLSRWTNFLTTDGEKEWREREAEFNNDLTSKEQILKKWNEGWACCLDTLNSLKAEELDTIIYIRNEGHTVMEAINRQLAHYPYHVGQIVFLAKYLAKNPWQSLSIPRGGTSAFNENKFSQEKSRKLFTDEDGSDDV